MNFVRDIPAKVCACSLRLLLSAMPLACGYAASAAELPAFETDQQADAWLRKHSAFYLKMTEAIDKRGGYKFLPSKEIPGGLAYTRDGQGYIELSEKLKGAHRVSIIIFEVTNLYQDDRHQEVTRRVYSGELNNPVEFSLLREIIEYD